tara:strand:+ start:4015 stop:4308 length:294 start_codon:yes stop_codon:yes gene_type:complete
MATNDTNSATALPKQMRQLSSAEVEELDKLHERFNYLSAGLMGIGTAAACGIDNLGEEPLEQLAHAVFALGQYAQDLTTRLEMVSLGIKHQAHHQAA